MVFCAQAKVVAKKLLRGEGGKVNSHEWGFVRLVRPIHHGGDGEATGEWGGSGGV